MLLNFVDRHLSITAFPDIEIPSLTIVTGLNGSGKTHLLQAIQSGAITNSVVQLRQNPGAQHQALFIGQGGPTIQFGQPYSSQMGNPAMPHPMMMGVEHLRQSTLNPTMPSLSRRWAAA